MDIAAADILISMVRLTVILVELNNCGNLLLFNSIQYGLEVLQAKQNDTKSLKKSLKVMIISLIWCFAKFVCH